MVNARIQRGEGKAIEWSRQGSINVEWGEVGLYTYTRVEDARLAVWTSDGKVIITLRNLITLPFVFSNKLSYHHLDKLTLDTGTEK